MTKRLSGGKDLELKKVWLTNGKIWMIHWTCPGGVFQTFFKGGFREDSGGTPQKKISGKWGFWIGGSLNSPKLGGGFKHVFNFTPIWGRFSI